jgi:hypothetical protein
MPEPEIFSPSTEEQAFLAQAFTRKLSEEDLIGFLAYLNGLSTHRFTGVYRFEPGWVVSVTLYDREQPDVRIGADVKMKESYCWLTGISEAAYVIEDAALDSRLDGHAARSEVRSYVAVLLHDKAGTPWGTLCHFDFAPRAVPPGTLSRLQSFRPLVEEMLVRETSAEWQPDAPSVRRARRLQVT